MYTATQCNSHTKGNHEFSEIRGQTLFVLSGPRILTSMQTDAGVFFGKENLPHLVTWMQVVCPQGTKMGATEHSILGST